MSKKRIMAIPGDIFACGHYRVIEPYTKLANMKHENLEFSLFNYSSKDENETTLDKLALRLASYDAVVFQRIFDTRLLGIMGAIKKHGVKVYMDIDDDLLNIAQTSPAWNTWKRGGEALAVFIKALEIADCVHVSTPELIEAYSPYTKKFEIFYNGLDVTNERYNPENSRRSELPQDKVVVMWTGSSTHFDSILEVKDAFKQVFDSRPNAVFALCSNKEFLDMFNISEEQKIFIEPVKMHEYYPIPSMCDIGLTPVKLNKFNNSKSELKCLEHGVWGIPVVSSPAAPYNRFHINSEGANIIAKKNRWQNWAKAVGELIDNETLRKELGERARRTVLETYNLDKINEKRIKFFEKELLK